MNEKILIVEDQFIVANNLRTILEKAGYRVCPFARSVPEAFRVIETEQPDMALIDIHLQGSLTGIDLAKELKDRRLAFVFISANSDKQILDAAKLTKPYGFLVKPFREKDVLVMLDVAWYLHQEKQAADNMVGASPEHNNLPVPDDELQRMVGDSPEMREVLENIRMVSPSETSVLLLGESGTGKELVAKAIHRSSRRRDKPLVVVNCAALPANLVESELFGHEKGAFTNAIQKKKGKFELADGGTIFLDELGEMSLETQVKFLRVLQEQEIEPIGGTVKKVSVRVIAATNRNLESEIAAGRFRLDLYYRLNVFPILLPPLRQRQADILPLATHFLKKYASKANKSISGLSEDMVNRMHAYSWPGNIRELENMMERVVLLSKGPIIDSLPLPMDQEHVNDTGIIPAVKTMDENERDHIIAVLKQCGWKLHGPGGAASLLKINEFTLRSRMKKLGIVKEKPAGKR